MNNFTWWTIKWRLGQLAFGCFGLVLLVFIALIVLAFSLDMYKYAKYGIGYIDQGSHRTFVMQVGEKKDGCISFKDEWGRDGKLCGDYTLVLQP